MLKQCMERKSKSNDFHTLFYSVLFNQQYFSIQLRRRKGYLTIVLEKNRFQNLDKYHLQETPNFSIKVQGSDCCSKFVCFVPVYENSKVFQLFVQKYVISGMKYDIFQTLSQHFVLWLALKQYLSNVEGQFTLVSTLGSTNIQVRNLVQNVNKNALGICLYYIWIRPFSSANIDVLAQ